MKYKELHGYKYRLETMEVVRLETLFPEITTDYVSMLLIGKNETIYIAAGYMWDGASGPTIDDKTNMRASVVHDALYQLMREGFMARAYRKAADEELRRLMIIDGLKLLQEQKKDNWFNRQWIKFRANYYYEAVRIFGAKTCLPEASPRGKIVEI